MTDAGDRLIEGAKEAVAIAKGEQPAARLHVEGWSYVPETLVHDLVVRATELVRLLDDAEVNHGGLWSGKTMKARDELRQELSRWTK